MAIRERSRKYTNVLDQDGVPISGTYSILYNKDGKVKGIAKPIHIGRSTHIWQIKIYQESKITCISRLTMAILKR